MDEKINIAIIGRDIRNPKWSILYDMLNQIEDEASYNMYDISNSKWEKKFSEDNVNYDGYIYLATVPKSKDKIYVHLKASASEQDIVDALSELANKLIGDTNDNISESIDIHNINDSSSGISIGSTNPDDIDVPVNGEIDTDNIIGHNPSRLIGINIRISPEKEVTLNKEDAFKLKELIELVKTLNYEIVDVIVDDNSTGI